MDLLDSLFPLGLLHEVSGVAEVVSAVGSSSVDQDSVELELFALLVFLVIVDQETEVEFQVEVEIAVDFDSVHFFVVELEPIEREDEGVRELLDGPSEPNILLGLTDIAEHFIVAVHGLGSDQIEQGTSERVDILDLEHEVEELLILVGPDGTILALLIPGGGSFEAVGDARLEFGAEKCPFDEVEDDPHGFLDVVLGLVLLLLPSERLVQVLGSHRVHVSQHHL